MRETSHVEPSNGDVVQHIVLSHGIYARWTESMDDRDCSHCVLRKLDCSNTPCGKGFYTATEAAELTDEERTSIVTQALTR